LNAAKVQTQKKLKLLLNINFNCYLFPLFFISLINNIKILLDQISFRTEQKNNKKKKKKKQRKHKKNFKNKK